MLIRHATSENWQQISFTWSCFVPWLSSSRHAPFTSSPPKAVGLLHSYRGTRKNRVSRHQPGFMMFSKICINACISCSVSRQSQHGWSGLISEPHHKDIDDDRKSSYILLPMSNYVGGHGSYCSCSNGHIIASWFLNQLFKLKCFIADITFL